jgi:hypothetical protein
MHCKINFITKVQKIVSCVKSCTDAFGKWKYLITVQKKKKLNKLENGENFQGKTPRTSEKKAIKVRGKKKILPL